MIKLSSCRALSIIPFVNRPDERFGNLSHVSINNWCDPGNLSTFRPTHGVLDMYKKWKFSSGMLITDYGNVYLAVGVNT